MFQQPFGITWRKALLSAPRLVPDLALYLTSPEGPHPIILQLPSRGSHRIPVYVFIPKSSNSHVATTSSDHPVLIDFHGGGFIFGSCQEQAPFCSKITRDLNAVSISVDYSLGPAAQFPAAVHDAEDVLLAVLQPSSPAYAALRSGINSYLATQDRPQITLDTSRLALSGFSSGGNLALNMALNIPANPSSIPSIPEPWPAALHAAPEGRLIPLLLFFPSFDARQLPSERPRPAGMQEKKGWVEGLKLETELMPTYLPREMAAHPRASPGLVPVDNGGLKGEVKVFLVLPEVDTLAEQSAAWIQRVEREGREGDLLVWKGEGMVHGWTQFPDSWLDARAKVLKGEVFERAVGLLRGAWEEGKWE